VGTLHRRVVLSLKQEEPLNFSDILLTGRVLIALVLLYASAAKVLAGREELRPAIENYGVVPRSLSGAVAVALPIVEGGLGLALLAGFLLPLSAIAASLLFALFAVAMTVNLTIGRTFPCACFGATAKTLISWRRVLLNVGLAAAALLSTGWPWLDSWDWPIEIDPGGTAETYTDTSWDVLIAVGLLLTIALVRAIVSLMRFKKPKEVEK
jgi:hypothetical protein